MLVAPSKKEQVFKDVKLREKGIKGRGLYSIDPILNESGAWLIKTKHQSQPLELNVSVAQRANLLLYCLPPQQDVKQIIVDRF